MILVQSESDIRAVAWFRAMAFDCPRAALWRRGEPKYWIGDILRFDRSEQDEFAAKEGVRIGVVAAISIDKAHFDEDRPGPMVRYYFEGIDDWCQQEFVICRMMVEPAR